MKPFEKLSKFYKKDWGIESTKYVILISNVINNYNLKVNSILDVACGTRILAKELMNIGFKVSGIDISEDMINIAKENTKDNSFKVADMKDFKLNRKFDIITCAFDSINYITNNKDMEKTLSNIFNHLENNGFFIFDINTPYLYEDKHFGTIERTFDDINFKQILEYDRVNRLGKTVFAFANNESETHIQKAYTVEEMDKFLLNSGFEIMGRYKNFKLSPIEDRIYKVFYVVKKSVNVQSSYIAD